MRIMAKVFVRVECYIVKHRVSKWLDSKSLFDIEWGSCGRTQNTHGSALSGAMYLALNSETFLDLMFSRQELMMHVQ